MTAYGISFPKMIAQAGRASGHLTVGKIRPHSSKPQQQHQNSSQPFSTATSTTNRPQNIMQAYQDFLPSS